MYGVLGTHNPPGGILVRFQDERGRERFLIDLGQRLSERLKCAVEETGESFEDFVETAIACMVGRDETATVPKPESSPLLKRS